MKRPLRYQFLSAITVGALAGVFAPRLVAGGGEVFCNSIPGPEIPEMWLNIPPSGVFWEINIGLQGTRICPGFPPIFCSASQHPMNQDDWPGFQSIMRAAATWTGAEVPAVPSSSMTSFGWDPVPGLMPYGCTMVGCPALPFLNSIIGQDAINLVTLWEPPSSFALCGGGAVVGIADVVVNFSTGEILEMDVALNALSEVVQFSGIPCWSFVEENVLESWTLASTTADLAAAVPFTPPTFGYADLEGILVHELGHGAGLGHSLVDGRQVPTESTTPTMFETGHTETFPDTLATHEIGNCFLSQNTVGGSQNALGGLLGAGLKTLERDDLSAIGAVYPSNDFATLTGSISGTVRDAANTPVLGAHVVAISKQQPNENRVGTLSMSGGVYRVEGLEPGDYYVYVEPVDQGTGGLFDPISVPNYVFLGTGQGGGCITSVVQHQTEFWDLNEGTGEPSPMAPDVVVVTAALDSPGIDFVVENLGDRLTVSSGTSSSNRGVALAPPPGTDPVVTFQAEMGPANANRLARLILGPDHGKRLLGGVLLQANQTGPPGWPIQLTKKADAFGSATFTVTITDAMAHHELIGQVAIRAHSGMPPSFTNPVSVVVENP